MQECVGILIPRNEPTEMTTYHMPFGARSLCFINFPIKYCFPPIDLVGLYIKMPPIFSDIENNIPLLPTWWLLHVLNFIALCS